MDTHTWTQTHTSTYTHATYTYTNENTNMNTHTQTHRHTHTHTHTLTLTLSYTHIHKRVPATHSLFSFLPDLKKEIFLCIFAITMLGQMMCEKRAKAVSLLVLFFPWCIPFAVCPLLATVGGKTNNLFKGRFTVGESHVENPDPAI